MHSYYIFYKPYLVISQFSPEGDKETLANFLHGINTDIYPVGRLDHDSEGLLLLTNDKALNHQLLDPSQGHERTYYAQVEGSITSAAISELANGVMISINGQQHKTKRARASVLSAAPILPERNPPIRYRKDIPTSWISLTLTQGKNRQVRRMTAAVGFPTLRLVRYSIGRVTIDGLQPGTYKEYGPEIKELLFRK